MHRKYGWYRIYKIRVTRPFLVLKYMVTTTKENLDDAEMDPINHSDEGLSRLLLSSLHWLPLNIKMLRIVLSAASYYLCVQVCFLNGPFSYGDKIA